MQIEKLHHIAIICSDYDKSKAFYTQVLGLTVLNETYRAERQSYKLDLILNDDFLIELFSFPCPPKRFTMPETCGLRHIAFAVKNIEENVAELNSQNIDAELIRIDEITGRCFTFFHDPDDLPIELMRRELTIS